MAQFGVTGSVRETHGKVCVEWKIPDFFSLPGDVDSCYLSPVFCLSDSCWRLRIYPHGRKETPEWVGLFVKRQDSGPPKSMTLSLGIKTADGVQEVSKTGTLMDKNAEFPRGWLQFISISELQNQWSEVAPSGVLTVTCTFTSDFPYPTEVSLSTRLWNLSLDLKRMQEERKGTDFTLKLKEGRELRAHRNILDARCGYFEGMLRNDFQENASGVADMDDIEDGVFQCILSYLYTGEAEGMADRNVCKIYLAADKLLLEELKTLCVYYMKGHLSLGLICDVVHILEKYDEADLKECTLNYFTEHAKEVYDSDAWKKFSKENSSLLLKFFEKLTVWKRP